MKTALALSTVTSVVLAAVTFMSFDTLPPFEYDAANSYVVPRRTEAGHQITVHWKLTRTNRICVGVITRSIVDAETGVRTIYDPTPAVATVGDREFSRTFMLPIEINPGRKFYYVDAAYGCNLLQRLWRPLVVRTPTLEFEILPTP